MWSSSEVLSLPCSQILTGKSAAKVFDQKPQTGEAPYALSGHEQCSDSCFFLPAAWNLFRAGAVEKTERNPEVFVKRLHHGGAEAFVAAHPSCHGKPCKEMKSRLFRDFQLCLENWAPKTWKRHTLPSSLSFLCHKPDAKSQCCWTHCLQYRIKQDQQQYSPLHTPRCKHSFEAWRSPSTTVLSWGPCVAPGQFVLCPRSRGQFRLVVLVTASVQTLCGSPLGWGQLVQYKGFPGPDVLVFSWLVLETLVSCGCNIVWYPNPVPCWNCVTALLGSISFKWWPS